MINTLRRHPSLAALVRVTIALAILVVAASGAEASDDQPKPIKVEAIDSDFEALSRLQKRMFNFSKPGFEDTTITFREWLLLTLATEALEAPLVALETGGRVGCSNPNTDGEGKSCVSKDKALDDLVKDLNYQCKLKCADEMWLKKPCGFFGHDFVKDDEDEKQKATCTSLTTTFCDQGKKGFVCEVADARCICNCVVA